MGENTGKWMAALIFIAAVVIGIRIKENTGIFSSESKECPIVTKVNRSDYKWNAYDESVLKFAYVRCSFKYRDKPCVGRFEKYGMKDYNVLCTWKR